MWLAVGVGTALVLGGCQSATPEEQPALEEKAEVSFASLVAAIQDYGPLENVVSDHEGALEYLGVDENLLRNYAAWLPEKNIITNQIFVGEAPSSDEAKEVADALLAHQQEVEELYATYLPEQEKLAKDGIVEQKGNFVFFVIDEDADGLLEVFHNQFR